MPAGSAVTTPVPLPDRVIASDHLRRLNSAPTVRAALIDTVQVVVEPLHAPDHPPNSEFASGVAVRVTAAPSANSSEQSPGHATPAG
jgi:hypothetical protein